MARPVYSELQNGRDTCNHAQTDINFSILRRYPKKKRRLPLAHRSCILALSVKYTVNSIVTTKINGAKLQVRACSCSTAPEKTMHILKKLAHERTLTMYLQNTVRNLKLLCNKFTDSIIHVVICITQSVLQWNL